MMARRQRLSAEQRRKRERLRSQGRCALLSHQKQTLTLEEAASTPQIKVLEHNGKATSNFFIYQQTKANLCFYIDIQRQQESIDQALSTSRASLLCTAEKQLLQPLDDAAITNCPLLPFSGEERPDSPSSPRPDGRDTVTATSISEQSRITGAPSWPITRGLPRVASQVAKGEPKTLSYQSNGLKNHALKRKRSPVDARSQQHNERQQRIRQQQIIHETEPAVNICQTFQVTGVIVEDEPTLPAPFADDIIIIRSEAESENGNDDCLDIGDIGGSLDGSPAPATSATTVIDAPQPPPEPQPQHSSVHPIIGTGTQSTVNSIRARETSAGLDFIDQQARIYQQVFRDSFRMQCSCPLTPASSPSAGNNGDDNQSGDSDEDSTSLRELTDVFESKLPALSTMLRPSDTASTAYPQSYFSRCEKLLAQPPPRPLSLRKDERALVQQLQQPIKIERTWDIDSVWLGVKALEAIRPEHTFKLSFLPPFGRNISGNQVIRPHGLDLGRTRNIYLGSVTGMDVGLSIFVLFPETSMPSGPRPGRKRSRIRTALSLERQKDLVDGAILPAVREAVPLLWRQVIRYGYRQVQILPGKTACAALEARRQVSGASPPIYTPRFLLGGLLAGIYELLQWDPNRTPEPKWKWRIHLCLLSQPSTPLPGS
jgi:hypothetical protein